MKRLRFITLVFLLPMLCIAQEAEQSVVKGTQLTLDNAMLMTLENNISLRIERMDPEIVELGETIAEAAFDPTISAGAGFVIDDETNTNGEERSAGDLSFDAGVSKRFSTGTRVDLGVELEQDE